MSYSVFWNNIVTIHTTGKTGLSPFIFSSRDFNLEPPEQKSLMHWTVEFSYSNISYTCKVSVDTQICTETIKLKRVPVSDSAVGCMTSFFKQSKSQQFFITNAGTVVAFRELNP